MMRLLQVCNVGQIIGGTAACAWTVTKCLYQCEHIVVFLRPISAQTRTAFSHCRIAHWEHVSAAQVRSADPDIVLLHNTSRGRVEEQLPAVTVQYLHSRIAPASADLTLYCSQWLARQYPSSHDRVCYQSVPKPQRPDVFDEQRALREHPVIGRICTPQIKKWPSHLPEFYALLAKRFPQVQWEFVGCPEALIPALSEACRGRVSFYPASWSMRSRLWHWDAMLYHNPAVTESFGRTVAEAMRAGCIPIVDRAGGFVEQLPEQGGFLCQSSCDFSEALAQLHAPARRLRMSRLCMAHADQQFSLARFGGELMRRFRAAVADG